MRWLRACGKKAANQRVYMLIISECTSQHTAVDVRRAAAFARPPYRAGIGISARNYAEGLEANVVIASGHVSGLRSLAGSGGGYRGAGVAGEGKQTHNMTNGWKTAPSEGARPAEQIPCKSLCDHAAQYLLFVGKISAINAW